MLKSLMVATAAFTLAATPAMAFDNHKDKTAKMEKKNYGKKKTIVDKAVATDALSTLVAAVTAGDLVETLSGEGPFTVFAPTNEGFAAIQSTVDTLLQPENKEQLQRVLTAHVVAADLTSTDLALVASANGGSVNLTTVSGDTLTVTVSDAGVTVTDEKGGVANVTIADVDASNGTVHVVDAVLVPEV
ncbi:MAG: fasciclin domain-containing protein [Pseudomonadota bacterium]